MTDTKQVSQLTEDMLSDKEKKVFKMLVKAGTPKQEALESILGLTKAGEKKLERGKRMQRLMDVVKPAFDLATQKLIKSGDLKVGDAFRLEIIKDGISLKPLGLGKGVGKVSATLTIEGKATTYESCKATAEALYEYAKSKGKLDQKDTRDFRATLDGEMGAISWHRTLPHWIAKVKGTSVKFEAGE